MRPEDIQKLLGGYATGTLTPEEQQVLFAAALEDQELFDALAREQSLRDLLRDPAARAELLSALDGPVAPIQSGGFWQWLRRPVVAGLVTAGVAGVAFVAVWRGTSVPVARQVAAPQIVAELRRAEPAPAAIPESANSGRAVPQARQFEARDKVKVADGPATIAADKKAALPSASSPASPSPTENRLEKDAVAPMAAPPPPPPVAVTAAAPALAARKAETDTATAGQSAEKAAGNAAGAVGGFAKENVMLDARALFYLEQAAPAPQAFVAPSGGGGAASPPVPRQDAAVRAKAASSLAMTAAGARLGVRVSILRGDREVDLTTVLDPGETVRLKVTPNTDGFLYIAEGRRTIASSAVQRLKPFETPEIRFQGSGQKQLVVTLSRNPQAVAPLSIGAMAHGTVVETSADQGRATYVVSGPRDAADQQVVLPVTLTYR